MFGDGNMLGFVCLWAPEAVPSSESTLARCAENHEPRTTPGPRGRSIPNLTPYSKVAEGQRQEAVEEEDSRSMPTGKQVGIFPPLFTLLLMLLRAYRYR